MKTLILLLLIFIIGLYLLPHYSPNILNELSDNVPKPTTSYNPDPQIVTLADQASMNDKAKQIFYAAYPQIDTDRNIFETHCKTPVSKNIVELGCYTSNNKIYILDIDNSKLSTQIVVTAAHEMLHAAYAKLSENKRVQVDLKLESILPKVQNQELTKELQNYKLTEPDQRDNELHSILGTEYAPLGSDLDNYYSQYFTDRQVVVNESIQFKNAFKKLENKLSSIKSQIQQLKVQMNQDLKNGDITGYNDLVPKVNSLIGGYNTTVKEYNDLSRSLRGEEQPVKTP